MQLSERFDCVEWIHPSQNTGSVVRCNEDLYSTKKPGTAIPYHEVFTCNGTKYCKRQLIPQAKQRLI